MYHRTDRCYTSAQHPGIAGRLPAAVEENRRAVAAVYDELHAQQPADFRYGTLLVPDENLFLHVALTEGDNAPLPGLAAFREFLSGLEDRVSAPVVSRDAVRVGGYGLY